MFDVINVNKPAGMTSHDVVARLRRVFSLKRVGHLGTLDPAAEGVLPVCLGYATRLIEYFPSGKAYRAEITLGITTSTLDQEGEILTQTACRGLTEESVQEVLKPFIGTFSQQVPMHSAVHVDGKKLYQLAHQGITVETPSKMVTIYDITLLEIQNIESPHPVLVIDVDCASGTYIRSLARDIGNGLGCGAHLSKLIRTRHGQFSLEKAVDLEVLMESPNPQQYLESPALYAGLPEAAILEEQTTALLANGMKIPRSSVEVSFPRADHAEQICLITYQSTPLAVAKVEGDALKPLKVFPKQSH